VGDPNGDLLNFGIDLLPEKGKALALERGWRDKFFTFDTLLVPDGRYRLEVTASDSPSQPFNLAQRSVWRTAAFTVDHTPPSIQELTASPEGDALRVRFLAKDDGSTLKEVALSADGDGWLQVVPEDRIFDAREERFDVLIPKERLKGDRVTVRVVDAYSNEQTAAIAVAEVKKH